MSESIKIDGACHCGIIRFTLLWPASELDIPVRKCGCTFCQKHAGAWTSNRSSELVIEIGDQSLVSKYNFGTKTADFYVCSVCGAVPFVLSEIDEKQYAVVNVNTFREIGDLSLCESSTNFDGEGVANRFERRRNNWIPKVVFRASAA